MSFPAFRQFALQGAAVFVVLSLAWPYFGPAGEAIPWLPASLAIGGVAFVLASLSRQPWWWRLIHGGFAPLAYLVGGLEIEPGWFLLGFLLLLLVYRGALSGQVPLYLSNRQTVEALAELIAERDASSFLDLGAGVGSTTIPLADYFPERHFAGVENAPLTWLVGRLLSIGRPNLAWRWDDLWQTSLSGHAVVYAFLSPVPMPRLWDKVVAEMQPGSLFVSNSFPVPGVVPSRMIEVPCTPSRTLYCYER